MSTAFFIGYYTAQLNQHLLHFYCFILDFVFTQTPILIPQLKATAVLRPDNRLCPKPKPVITMKILFLILLIIPGISLGNPGSRAQTDRDLGLSTGKGRQDGIIHVENARHLAGIYSIAPATTSVSPQSQQVFAKPTFNKQYERFRLDDFEWSIVNIHAFSELGSSDNPQHPSNGAFIVVEFEATNISNKAQYVHSNLVLTADGRQYESSSYSVYAKYQMNYESGHSVKVEPGVTHKTYFVFDAKHRSNYKLIMRGFLSDERIVKEINI
jgi:hypothetical protein